MVRLTHTATGTAPVLLLPWLKYHTNGTVGCTAPGNVQKVPVGGQNVERVVI